MDWPAGTLPYQLPFTLGHETAGTVAALGAGARGVAEGDRVLVHARWGCGTCWHCLQGMENGCERTARELGGHGGGVGRDGGLAIYTIVPSARYLVPIGDLDRVAAAPLSDAALTPYHAIKGSLAVLRPGAAVVVIGVGGIGDLAVRCSGRSARPGSSLVDVRRCRRCGWRGRPGAHAAVPGARSHRVTASGTDRSGRRRGRAGLRGIGRAPRAGGGRRRPGRPASSTSGGAAARCRYRPAPCRSSAPC